MESRERELPITPLNSCGLISKSQDSMLYHMGTSDIRRGEGFHREGEYYSFTFCSVLNTKYSSYT